MKRRGIRRYDVTYKLSNGVTTLRVEANTSNSAERRAWRQLVRSNGRQAAVDASLVSVEFAGCR